MGLCHKCMSKHKLHNYRVVLSYETMKGVLVGYARVSRLEQNLEAQISALNAAGCGKIFAEKVSSVKVHRVELDSLLAYIRSGDTLVVWKLDRLSRSLKELITLSEDLKNRDIHLISLTDNLDTSHLQGKIFFYFLAIMAELERDNIRERTLEGLAHARQLGKLGGRPKKIFPTNQIIVNNLYQQGTSVKNVAALMNVSTNTIYRNLNPITATEVKEQ